MEAEHETLSLRQAKKRAAWTSHCWFTNTSCAACMLGPSQRTKIEKSKMVTATASSAALSIMRSSCRGWGGRTAPQSNSTLGQHCQAYTIAQIVQQLQKNGNKRHRLSKAHCQLARYASTEIRKISMTLHQPRIPGCHIYCVLGAWVPMMLAGCMFKQGAHTSDSDSLRCRSQAACRRLAAASPPSSPSPSCTDAALPAALCACRTNSRAVANSSPYTPRSWSRLLRSSLYRRPPSSVPRAPTPPGAAMPPVAG